MVTGAGRGIGREIALAMAEAGARVGLLPRTEAELDDACAEINATGGSAVALVAGLGSLLASPSPLRSARSHASRTRAN